MVAVAQEKLKRLENDASRRFIDLVSATGLTLFAYAVFIVAISEPSLEWVLLGLVTTLVVGRCLVAISAHGQSGCVTSRPCWIRPNSAVRSPRPGNAPGSGAATRR